MSSFPAEALGISPSAARKTFSTAGVSGREQITVSQCCSASLGEAAALAPCATTRCTAASTGSTAQT